MSERATVIVRAWGNEPVALQLFRVENDGAICFVGSEHAKRPIGLPSGQVFQFDPDLFAKLRSAYETGATQTLETLYAQLSPCAVPR